MIINVKGTKIKLVIPDGFKKLKVKNPLKELQNSKDGIDAYQKVTPNANCLVMVNKTTQELAMDLDDCESLISGIHAALSDNQGLIVAKNGVTERGYRYIYSIVRTVLSDEQIKKATYFLRMNLEYEEDYVEIKADFTEIGTTGIRDNMGFAYARKAQLVNNSGGLMTDWREDPYDAAFTRGLPNESI